MVPAVLHEPRWLIASCFPDLSDRLVKESHPRPRRIPSSFQNWLYFTCSGFQQSWGPQVPALCLIHTDQAQSWAQELTWAQELRVSVFLGSSKSAYLGFLQVKRAVSAEPLQSGRWEYSVAFPLPPLSPTTLVVSGGDTVAQPSKTWKVFRDACSLTWHQLVNVPDSSINESWLIEEEPSICLVSKSIVLFQLTFGLPFPFLNFRTRTIYSVQKYAKYFYICHFIWHNDSVNPLCVVSPFYRHRKQYPGWFNGFPNPSARESQMKMYIYGGFFILLFSFHYNPLHLRFSTLPFNSGVSYYIT